MNRRAVTGALLIDGGDGPPRPGHTVIWDEDQIVWVGPDGDADLGEARVMDAGGGAVLPGLIDAHVHLCLEPTLQGVEQLATEQIATVAIRSATAARRLLDAGITTARDQGSRDGVAIEVAAAQRNGWLIGSRILAAGRGITPPGGHGWMIGVEAEGADAIREAVATEIERGADVIKLFPTGGVLGSGAHGFSTTMTAAELGAGAAEAHRHDRIAGAHVHGPEGVAISLEAGIDTIEHGTALTAGQAEEMASRGVVLVPTLTALEALVEHAGEVPAEVLRRTEDMRAEASAAAARAIAAGVTVLPGTDAGTPFNPPGRLVAEMERLAGLGLGNHGVIRAATAEAARVLRLPELGRIAPGYRADLVLVPGNPVDNLALLHSPQAVVQDGKVRVLI